MLGLGPLGEEWRVRLAILLLDPPIVLHHDAGEESREPPRQKHGPIVRRDEGAEGQDREG